MFSSGQDTQGASQEEFQFKTVLSTEELEEFDYDNEDLAKLHAVKINDTCDGVVLLISDKPLEIPSENAPKVYQYLLETLEVDVNSRWTDGLGRELSTGAHRKPEKFDQLPVRVNATLNTLEFAKNYNGHEIQSYLSSGTKHLQRAQNNEMNHIMMTSEDFGQAGKDFIRVLGLGAMNSENVQYFKQAVDGLLEKKFLSDHPDLQLPNSRLKMAEQQNKDIDFILDNTKPLQLSSNQAAQGVDGSLTAQEIVSFNSIVTRLKSAKVTLHESITDFKRNLTAHANNLVADAAVLVQALSRQDDLTQEDVTEVARASVNLTADVNVPAETLPTVRTALQALCEREDLAQDTVIQIAEAYANLAAHANIPAEELHTIAAALQALYGRGDLTQEAVTEIARGYNNLTADANTPTETLRTIVTALQALYERDDLAEEAVPEIAQAYTNLAVDASTPAELHTVATALQALSRRNDLTQDAVTAITHGCAGLAANPNININIPAETPRTLGTALQALSERDDLTQEAVTEIMRAYVDLTADANTPAETLRTIQNGRRTLSLRDDLTQEAADNSERALFNLMMNTNAPAESLSSRDDLQSERDETATSQNASAESQIRRDDLTQEAVEIADAGPTVTTLSEPNTPPFQTRHNSYENQYPPPSVRRSQQPYDPSSQNPVVSGQPLQSAVMPTPDEIEQRTPEELASRIWTDDRQPTANEQDLSQNRTRWSFIRNCIPACSHANGRMSLPMRGR